MECYSREQLIIAAQPKIILNLSGIEIIEIGMFGLGWPEVSVIRIGNFNFRSQENSRVGQYSCKTCAASKMRTRAKSQKIQMFTSLGQGQGSGVRGQGEEGG